MSPKDQATALRLLRRWRDLCIDADRRASEKSNDGDDLAELTGLYIETEAFLFPGVPPKPIRFVS